MPRNKLSDSINLQAESLGWINYNDFIKAGYTTEEIEQLTKDSLINNFDIVITTEEATKTLKEAMKKYELR
jgi:uncharacterized membrane protein